MSISLYPLTFQPIFKERVWGGRNLERLFDKKLPENAVIGESWEISDRPGDVSVIDFGELKGTTLHDLIVERTEEVMGTASLLDGRFPLLVKILDAQDKLSLQVHPPKAVASKLGGDSKTEMWYIADCTDNADLFVGLRSGMTRAEFAKQVEAGAVASCFHRIEVKVGDSMFLPSGRVHAIGAGNVIFEIQENSDTTYRVHDWDRVGLDGKPRELHLEESMESIAFDDYEPSLAPATMNVLADGVEGRTLADCREFKVAHLHLAENREFKVGNRDTATVVGVISGTLTIEGGGVARSLTRGQFSLLPASVDGSLRSSTGGGACLVGTCR